MSPPLPAHTDSPDLRRTIALAVLPQAGAWAVIMTLTTATLQRVDAGARVFGSPLGVLARFGEPWTALSVVVAGTALAAAISALPGSARWRVRAVQVIGLAYSVALVAWSHATLAALPFLAEVLDAVTPGNPYAWAFIPVAIGGLLVLYLGVLGDEGKGAFPTLEIAHLFVLVAALSLPFIPWDLDRHLPLDIALFWSGPLGAGLAGLTFGLALDLAWRKLPRPHARFGPWFVFAVSTVTALAVVRRLTYVFDVLLAL